MAPLLLQGLPCTPAPPCELSMLRMVLDTQAAL